ncbi:MAG: MAPEG family protein [Myxococcales bacterium]|nr:MAPEG family protein [Myxococcales bacterium]MCB9549562.1 MAPEG family protein [Myxococcales bacterium]
MLTQDPVFQLYIGTVIALALNLIILANTTVISRGKAKEVVNPEDAALSSGAAVVYEGGNERTARHKRAHRNALENIPLFMVTGLLLAMVGVSATTAAVLYGVFVVARYAHTFAYLRSMQPWRTISFVIGLLDQVAVLGFLAYATFLR